MIVLLYDKENIINRILNCTNLEEVQSLTNDIQYKIFEDTNAQVGININALDEQGVLKSVQQMINENLMTIGDNQEIRDGEIYELTDDEMKAKFPDRYSIEQEMMEATPEQILMREISAKQQEITNLKDQYLDSDIDNDELLKQSLRVEIQNKKSELLVLQESIQTDQDTVSSVNH